MKSFYFLLLTPVLSFAQFQKPELLARYAGTDALNLPLDSVCFSSEPAVTRSAVYLDCQDMEGSFMVQFKEGESSILARANSGQGFSRPMAYSEGVAWTERDEWGASRSFVLKDKLSVENIPNLGPLSVPNDSYLPLGQERWVYRLKGEPTELWMWSKGEAKRFFHEEVSFIFPPVVSEGGSFAIKIRKNNWNESAPDELWLHHENRWVKILSDRDADPTSPWISFRNQMAVDAGSVLLVARDASGDALLRVSEGRVEVIARSGGEIKEFDYFSPKMRGDMLVFRGVDQQKRKALWFFHQNKLGRLVTQGDLVMSDKGPARIHYENEHAIFYGAPGIGPEGEVVQQATLTDPDYPSTLIGVGVIKFNRE